MPKPSKTQNFILRCICKPHTSLNENATMARSISMAKISTATQRYSYVYVSCRAGPVVPWGITDRASTKGRTMQPWLRHLLTKSNYQC
jgi:hypothetical protein